MDTAQPAEPTIEDLYQRNLDRHLEVALAGFGVSGNRVEESRIVREGQYLKARSTSLAVGGVAVARRTWMAEHSEQRFFTE